MADIFLKADASHLFKGKRILFLGDSNIRALYKDVLQLVISNSLISEKTLKLKLPVTVRGDKLVKYTQLTKGREFEEERVLDKDGFYFRYAFIARCYTKKMETILKQLTNEIRPDVVIINSCLWDITRWGPDGVDTYKENLHKLIKRFKETLSPTAMVIWTTTLPVAQEMRGGFLIPQVAFMKYQLRYEVMEANFYTWQLFTESGFDVIDFHYHLQMQIVRRADDGVHWMPEAVRHMTNLVLTHIALAWRVPLPGNFHSLALDKKVNGYLLPAIDAPPLPPLPKHDAALKPKPEGMAPPQPRATPTRGRRKARAASRRRGPRNNQRMENTYSSPSYYNDNDYSRRRYVAKAVRRLNGPRISPDAVSQIQRFLRPRNYNDDVLIRAPWYK